MGSWLATAWQYNTLRIENPDKEVGTGFLVAVEHNQLRHKRKYLIANRHVVSRDDGSIHPFVRINLYFQNRNRFWGRKRRIYLSTQTGNSYKLHTNPIIDICAIDATPLMDSLKHCDVAYVDLARMVTPRLVNEMQLSWGDEILTIGYPEGISQGDVTLPIIKPGLISSDPLLPIDFEDELGIYHKNCPAFFVGSETVGGQSGSLVVLRPTIGRYYKQPMGNFFDMNPAELVLLGIISDGYDFLPLSIAWNARAIIDTILEFFPQRTFENLMRLQLRNMGYQAPQGFVF